MARKQVVSITIQQCAQVQRAAQADQSPKCQLIWRYLLNFCCQRWKRQQARCWQTWNQKHSFESKRMESWLEILYIWVFVTPIAGSWQVVSKIQKHSVDYFQPAYFCSQKRTSLTINSNHVQNRCQQINSGFWFGVFFGLGFEILVGVLVFFQLLGFFVCLIIDIRIPASTVWAGLFKVIFIPFYNF